MEKTWISRKIKFFVSYIREPWIWNSCKRVGKYIMVTEIH